MLLQIVTTKPCNWEMSIKYFILNCNQMVIVHTCRLASASIVKLIICCQSRIELSEFLFEFLNDIFLSQSISILSHHSPGK